MCCAAGLAAIETYEQEELVERSRKLGAWMHGHLREIAAHHPSIGDVRGMGLFAALELIADRETRRPLAPWPQVPSSLQRLKAEAKRRGLTFTVRGNLLILSPPLIIEKDDLAWGLKELDDLLVLTDDDYGTEDATWQPERVRRVPLW